MVRLFIYFFAFFHSLPFFFDRTQLRRYYSTPNSSSNKHAYLCDTPPPPTPIYSMASTTAPIMPPQAGPMMHSLHLHSSIPLMHQDHHPHNHHHHLYHSSGHYVANNSVAYSVASPSATVTSAPSTPMQPQPHHTSEPPMHAFLLYESNSNDTGGSGSVVTIENGFHSYHNPNLVSSVSII